VVEAPFFVIIALVIIWRLLIFGAGMNPAIVVLPLGINKMMSSAKAREFDAI